MSTEGRPATLPELVCAGEALTDMLLQPDGEHWLARNGGAPWNVARAAATQGVRTAFAGAISRDHFGDALWRDSEAAGLDLRFLQRVDRPPLLAMVPSSQPPRYFFIGENSADLAFDPAALPAGWMAARPWLLLGCISLAREPLAGRLLALADAAHAAGCPIAYDPNMRNLMGPGYAATFERLARIARVIKLSDEDLRQLQPGVAAEDALRALRAAHPSAWWLFTEGARGARLLTPQGQWQALPPPVTVVDTVGAGDAAMAGLLASLVGRPEAEPGAHLAWAVACGSAACAVAGARAPSPTAVQALYEQTPVR